MSLVRCPHSWDIVFTNIRVYFQKFFEIKKTKFAYPFEGSQDGTIAYERLAKIHRSLTALTKSEQSTGSQYSHLLF